MGCVPGQDIKSARQPTIGKDQDVGAEIQHPSQGAGAGVSPRSARTLGSVSSCARIVWQAVQSWVIGRAVGALVVVVVAAEAAEEVLVPDVVRVRPPAHLHVREDVALVDRLQLRRPPPRPARGARGRPRDRSFW